MALAPLSVPPGFSTLSAVYCSSQDAQVNIVGVVVDFLPATKTNGTDFTIKFTVHDQTCTNGIGLPVRFFHKQENQLPGIQNQGDLVILRNVKLKEYTRTRVPTVLSNSSSNWVVLEYSSLQQSSDPNGVDVTIHQSGTGTHLAARPNSAELQYAKALLEREDPSRWPQPARNTALSVAAIQRSNGGIPTAMPDKYRKIESLQVPAHRNDAIYVDLLAEVRRIYPLDNRVELSITDYTEHQILYNYIPESEDTSEPFDGDRFRYIENTHKAWPGPWGKMAMLIILWPPHRDYAMSHVELGSFVSLKNVQITLDRDGGKLEGHCRTERLYEMKVNVNVLSPGEAASNERLKSLLERKRAYEEQCRKRNLPFKRDPKLPSPGSKERQAAQQLDAANLTAKQKRNREKKKRQRNKKANDAANTEADEADNDASDAPTTTTLKENSLNTNVRCENKPITLSTITSILDSSILHRKTPAGNPFSLPFQNCIYKSKIRVIDFFPYNLQDFAVPVRESQYAALQDEDGDSGSDVDLTQEDVEVLMSSGDGSIRWEWRFMLLVEDARPSAKQDRKTDALKMEVLVADSDADYLLRNIEACDLRRNPGALAKLREKLFFLWGDLQEQKEEMLQKGEVGAVGKVSAKPFECFIKEYGVRDREDEEWERMFRLCYTSI